jgi:hypothetical protein
LRATIAAQRHKFFQPHWICGRFPGDEANILTQISHQPRRFDNRFDFLFRGQCGGAILSVKILRHKICA